jgi:tRNA(fMet)-specific endonuclease VapC
LGGLTILTFPEPAIRRYEQLKSSRLNVGKKDLRIAAIALEHGGIVVTRNLRDFQRVPGLTVENWAA